MPREALAAFGSKRARAINVPQILGAVALHFGMTKPDLVSKKRSRSVTFPRQIGMYLARSLTDLSLGEIGKQFGGRDHTTVLYACEKIDKRQATEKSLARTLKQIRAALIRDFDWYY